MQKDDLIKKHCIPCEGGTKSFDEEKIRAYMPGLSLKWDVIDGKKIRHEFTFKNFLESIAFINTIAPIAEAEGHHPDIFIFYNKVTIELWTHAIGGLSENDFILAAKLEHIYPNVKA